MSQFGLPKSSRLYRRKQIEELFEQGEAQFAHPVRAVYRVNQLDDSEPVKAAFSVSKRNFKRAVDRNRYKRILREAYRLNCQKLKEAWRVEGKQLTVMFIYASKEQLSYQTVEQAMRKMLGELLPLPKRVRSAKIIKP